MRLLMKESYTVDYAGFWARLVAMAIDAGILWALNYVLYGVWNIATNLPWGGSGVEQFGETVSNTVSQWGWRVVTIFFAQVAYFICFWAWRGQTPGKMVMRLKITRLDGSPIGWGTAIIRYLGYIISVFIIFAGFFWIGFDARRQGVHDKIAETYVINQPRKESTRQSPA